ncbi:transposase [Streptomyces sp. PTM05]|uniref:Transposase n=1 Tax=Streptantibioticus parmotrematis TaxID=2873249 RepID=A0ABS7QUX1_9ACTN|nr:transposase [Streptantibioticus parmotrematis]
MVTHRYTPPAGNYTRAGPCRGHSKRGSVDRGRPGSKHHLIVDRHGTPLAVTLIGGNRHDVTQLMPPPTLFRTSAPCEAGPRRRLRWPVADRGYDFDKCRRLARARGITPKTARRRTPQGSGLDKTRWAVERTFVWLHQFKRLRTRYEIRAYLHLGPTRLRHHPLETTPNRILK